MRLAVLASATIAMSCAGPLPPSSGEQTSADLTPGSEYTSTFRRANLPQHFERSLLMDAAHFEAFWNSTRYFRDHAILHGLEGEVVVANLETGRNLLAYSGCDVYDPDYVELPESVARMSLTRGFYSLYRIPEVSDEEWVLLTPEEQAARHAKAHVAWDKCVRVRRNPADSPSEAAARLDLSPTLKVDLGDLGRVELTSNGPLDSLERLRRLRDFVRSRLGALVGFQYHTSFDLAGGYSPDVAYAIYNFWYVSNEFVFLTYLSESAFFARAVLSETLNLENGTRSFWNRPPDIRLAEIVLRALVRHRTGPSALATEPFVENGVAANPKFSAVGLRTGIYRSLTGEVDAARVGLEPRVFAQPEFDEAALWYVAQATHFAEHLDSVGTADEVGVKFGPRGSAYSPLITSFSVDVEVDLNRIESATLDAAPSLTRLGTAPGRWENRAGDPLRILEIAPLLRFDRRRELQGCKESIARAREDLAAYVARRSDTSTELEDSAAAFRTWGQAVAIPLCL